MVTGASAVRNQIEEGMSHDQENRRPEPPQTPPEQLGRFGRAADGRRASADMAAYPDGADCRTSGGDVAVQGVEFKNNDITMSGNIYYPKGFNEGQKYAAIVVVHPGGGVKEQAAGLYAQKLAQKALSPWRLMPLTRAPAAACPALSTIR